MEFRCSKAIFKNVPHKLQKPVLEQVCQRKPQRYDQTTRPKNVVKLGIIGLRKIRPEDVVKVGRKTNLLLHEVCFRQR